MEDLAATKGSRAVARVCGWWVGERQESASSRRWVRLKISYVLSISIRGWEKVSEKRQQRSHVWYYQSTQNNNNSSNNNNNNKIIQPYSCTNGQIRTPVAGSVHHRPNPHAKGGGSVLGAGRSALGVWSALWGGAPWGGTPERGRMGRVTGSGAGERRRRAEDATGRGTGTQQHGLGWGTTGVCVCERERGRLGWLVAKCLFYTQGLVLRVDLNRLVLING